jgi:hypothetical protein
MAKIPEITWTLTVDQANQVMAAVAKQPFEQVADLIVELRNQAQEQLKAQQPPQMPPMPGSEAKPNGEARAQ